MERVSSSSMLVVALATGFCTSLVLSQIWQINKKKEDDNNSACSDSVATVLKIIQQRRSIFPKQYSSKPVPREILEDMLEAARWAPTHHLTEPWEYIIYESSEARKQVGQFLADSYKEACEKSGKDFSQAKYDKKLSNASKSSAVIAIVCDIGSSGSKNPVVEEVCTVAMSVQNMLLLAAAHEIGAYWSSASVHGGDKNSSNSTSMLVNPPTLCKFFGWDEDSMNNHKLCLGWIFVGDYYGDDKEKKKWPLGRRKDFSEQRIVWK